MKHTISFSKDKRLGTQFKHKYNGAQLETAQNSRLQVASGHSGAENSKNWRFYLYLLIPLSSYLDYYYPYFVIIFILIAKETQGCRWAEVTMKPKTARIENCILTFLSLSLFPHNFILS